MRRFTMALALLLGAVAPAAAQPWFPFEPTDFASADYVFLVYDQERGDYRTISMRDLFEGLIEFPDTLQRHVAVKFIPPARSDSTPTFVAGDFTASSPNQLVAVDVPNDTTAMGGWFAVAVPSGTAIPFLGLSRTERPRNSVNSLVRDAGYDVTIGGQPFDVWVSWRAQGTILTVDGFYIFFSQNAAIPTTP